MTRAAYNGHLPIVEWLHVHRSQECSVPAIEEAALCNNFEVVLFLHYQRHEKYTSKIAVQSYENGSPEIHEWIIQRYPEYREAVEAEHGQD